MERLKYLLLGISAILLVGCGQTVVETLNVPQAAGPDSPGYGMNIVILPFADYSNGNDIASAHRRNMKVTESLTDSLVQNGFGLPIQEDVLNYMMHENIINIAAYNNTSSKSLSYELTNEWSRQMKEELRSYMAQQNVGQDNAAVASPGTHGLNSKTVAKLGRTFKADYILRGRILEYTTREEVSWVPWRKGLLPFVVSGTNQILYGFAGSDKYDEWNHMVTAGAMGAGVGEAVSWPYGGSDVLQGAEMANNSVVWGALGMGLGKMTHNSGKIDQAVVQLRVWIQDATSGEVVWTNRVRVQVSPETVYADNKYDTLFDTAIHKGVTALIDNFVISAL